MRGVCRRPWPTHPTVVLVFGVHLGLVLADGGIDLLFSRLARAPEAELAEEAILYLPVWKLAMK